MTEKIEITAEDVAAINLVHDDFVGFYEKALQSPIIKKPVAWALYQTWKEWDAQERKRKIRYAKERETKCK